MIKIYYNRLYPLLSIEGWSAKSNVEGHAISILNGVSLHVYPGEIIGFTGASGCGKSFLAKSILGLLSYLPGIITEGKIIFNGKDLTETKASEYNLIRGKQISLIVQQPLNALNPMLTCGKQFIEAMATDNHSQKSAEDLNVKMEATLVKVGFNYPKTILSSYPHQLSGGEIQRLMTAIATINNPSIIIADEATSSLDPEAQKDIVTYLLQQNKKHNTAILFISHDLDLLYSISHRIVIMDKGEIKQTISSPFKKNTIIPSIKPSIIKSDHQSHYTDKPEPKSLLSFECIYKAYPTAASWFNKSKVTPFAIKNVSFSLVVGSITALIGPSGSGKSTMARIAAGLIASDGGNVYYNGEVVSFEMWRLNKRLRKNVQLIFQDPLSSFNPALTLLSQLKESYLVTHRLKNNADFLMEIALLLKRLNLKTDVLQALPHEVSGGQLQRVALCRILMLKPEIIIFDESLSALDFDNQQIMMDMIQELVQTGSTTALFITHDKHLVTSLCDNILVIQDGQIVESGLLEVVLQQPKHAFTKLFFKGLS